MVIDVCTYCNEKDIFDLRYNILSPYVDEFIVVEFNKTFSGQDKPWYFEEILDKYPKVRYNKVTNWEKYEELAKSSPNTQYGKGAEHWITEFCQKESIKDCLTHLNDDDIVFIGDCDEIWNPDEFILTHKTPYNLFRLKLKVYTYWLNHRSNEQFWGILVANYKFIKNECLNHLRSQQDDKIKSAYEYGWHFTSMAKSLKQKLKDSYTDEDYATDAILEQVDENIENDKDFLGRAFTYKKDESKWPEYLKNNREKYKHLLK